MIEIINPDKQVVEKTYVLYKKEKPTLKANQIGIKIPLKNIVTLAGTDVGMLSVLGCEDKIVGVMNHHYIANKKVLKNVKAGKVNDYIDFSQMNPESISMKTSFISYSGFGTPPPNEDKLAKLGVLCLPDYDWREEHPLGKAEWLYVFALLFDKEKEADTYFNKIEKEFLSLVKEAKKVKNKPTVLSGCMIGDYWYMPSGTSYNAFLFEKAGGDYLGKKKTGTGSQTYTFEEVLKNYQEADYWVNLGFDTKAKLLQSNAKYKYFKAFKNNTIYDYSHNMHHFWEMSAVEPQKVLSDLLVIFHPETFKKQLYFYKKLDE